MSAPTQLLSALAETSRALSARDALGAAAAMQLVHFACEQMRASGAPLGTATLVEARELVERCHARAAELQAHLEEQLAQAGLGRRAAAAYHHPR